MHNSSLSRPQPTAPGSAVYAKPSLSLPVLNAAHRLQLHGVLQPGQSCGAARLRYQCTHAQYIVPAPTRSRFSLSRRCLQKQQHVRERQGPRLQVLAAGSLNGAYQLPEESPARGSSPLSARSIGSGLVAKAKTLLAELDGLWSRFIPMSLLFFTMAFNNTVLDSVKDSLVITAKGGGAAVIPFITVYGVLPCSLLFLLGYSYATQRFKRKTVFNVVVGFFLSFFTLFAWIYPMHESLHSHPLATAVAKVLPSGLHGLVGMVKNWTYTLFYCFSELWGDVVLSLLFWGLANEITPMKHAPLLYPLFGIGANLAQVAGGRVLSVLARSADDSAQYVHYLRLLLMLVVALGIVSMALHSYILRKFPRTHEGVSRTLQERERKVLQRRQSNGSFKHSNGKTALGPAVGTASTPSINLSNGHHEPPTLHRQRSRQEGPACLLPPDDEDAVSSSKKVSVREAFSFLAQSPQIRALALMAIAQGVCTNVLDLAWKSHLRMLHPSPAGYSAFMGEVAVATGVVTGVLMVLTPVLFRLWRWRGVAGFTPRFMFMMGIPFFAGCILFNSQVLRGGALTATSIAVLRVLVIMGAVLQVFGKGAKFSMFKPAEEMVYISLDSEISRTKGKAAIDVVGAQTGKSTGSVIQQLLLLATGGSVAGLLPFLFVIYLGMLMGWLNSVNVIATDYNPETHHAEDNPAIPDTLLLQTLDEEDGVGPKGAADLVQPVQ